MFDLKFTPDKYHLAYKLWIFQILKAKASSEEARLKNKIRAKFESYAAYCFFEPKYLGYGLCWAKWRKPTFKPIRDEIYIDAIFEEIFNSRFFQEKLKGVQKYKQALEKTWKENQVWVRELEKITGLKSSEKLEVFVLPPELNMGAYLGHKQIEWGHEEVYRGYDFIGLCHETLHFLTEKQFNQNKTEAAQWKLHALICLATDEELRRRRFGGEYMQARAPYLKSERLMSEVKRLLPRWKKYMDNKAKMNTEKGNFLDYFFPS